MPSSQDFTCLFEDTWPRWVGRLAFTMLTSVMVCQGSLAQSLPSSEEDALQARIEKIELDRDASLEQYRADKKSCAKVVLVSRCTSEALARRRARDAVLRDGQISAKQQLRTLAAKAKNADLANQQARTEQQNNDDTQRQNLLAQRAQKLADAQERQNAHQQKKSQEDENRRAYLDKVKRSEERQAEIRARFKASGTQPKASAMLETTPGISANSARQPPSTTSAN
jgi:hypothetical protein